MIWNYIKVAFRNLYRHKVFSLINILGLSIGLACAILIILFTKDELSFDRFHKNGDRIYRIVTERFDKTGKMEGAGGFTGYLHGPSFAAKIPEIEAYIRYQPYGRDVKKGEEVIRQGGLQVDPAFLKVFSFPLLYGDPSSALANPNSVVVNEDVAIKFFGTTDVLGKTMLFKAGNGFEPFIITGVAKRCPENSSIRFQLLTPLQVPEAEMANKDNWFNFFLNTFVLLAPGADPEKVSEKMQQVYESEAKDAIIRIKREFDSESDNRYLLQPVKDLHLGTMYGSGNGLAQSNSPRYSIILSAIALFILAIACINFINLTIARSLKRSKEIGVRKVIGGSRKQLIVQFLSESFILSLFAFILSLLLVQLALPGFNFLANKKLSLSYLLDSNLVIGFVLLLIFTSLMAGFYPALVLSAFDPVKTLYNRFKFGGKGFLQKALVVLQFSLATILIIGSLTIYRQFNYLIEKPLGYNDKNLISVEKDNLTKDEFNRFKQAIMQQPFIEGVAPRNNGEWSTVAKVNGDKQLLYTIETINEDYIDLMGIKIVEGRNFDTRLASDSLESVLVNESFVKAAGWKKGVGQEINIFWDNNRTYRVIGVVADHHYGDLLRPIGPQMLSLHVRDPYGTILVRIAEGSESKAIEFITATFKKLFPIEPYDYAFRVDQNREAYETEERWKNIFFFGTLLSIFIACIGLFGLSMLNAERRKKEVGIRKVLGSSVIGIVSRLSVEFLILVGISLLIGIPIALYGTYTWLSNYPYRIEPGFFLVLSTVLLLSLIAMLTIGFQSFRAAFANPVNSLRTE